MRLTLVLALVASLPRLGGSGVDSAATVITGRVRAAVMLMLPDRQRRPCGIAVRLRGGQGAEGAAAAQIRAVLGRRSALLGPVCSLPGVGDAEGSEGTRAPLHAAESGATDRKLAGAGHAVGAKTCADITLQGSTAGADHEREVSGAQHIARSWEQQMKDVFEASEEQERAEQLAKARAALADFECMRPSLADWPGLSSTGQKPSNLGVDEGGGGDAVSAADSGAHKDEAGDGEDSLQLPKNTPLVLATAKARQDHSILQRYEALQEGRADEMEYYRARKAEFDRRLSARPIHNEVLGCSERVTWDAKNALRWEQERDSRPDSSHVLRDFEGRRVTLSGELLGGEEESPQSSPPAQRGPGKYLNIPRWARRKDNLPSIHFSRPSARLAQRRGTGQRGSNGKLLSGTAAGKEAAVEGGGNKVDGESNWVESPWAAASAAKARRRAGAATRVGGAEEEGGRVSGREKAVMKERKVRMALMHMRSVTKQRFPFLTKKNFKRAQRAQRAQQQ